MNRCASFPDLAAVLQVNSPPYEPSIFFNSTRLPTNRPYSSNQLASLRTVHILQINSPPYEQSIFFKSTRLPTNRPPPPHQPSVFFNASRLPTNHR